MTPEEVFHDGSDISYFRYAQQVKSLTPKYFPGVKPEAVIFVTNRVPVRLLNPQTFVDGAGDRNVSAWTFFLTAAHARELALLSLKF